MALQRPAQRRDRSRNSTRDAEESVVRQVETQTPEDIWPRSSREIHQQDHLRTCWRWKVGTTKAATQTTRTQDEVATVKKLLRGTRVDFQETAKVQKVQMAPLSRRPQEPSDFLILYHFLVRDRGLPQGFGEAFSNRAADWQDITASRVSNLQSSGWILERNKEAAQLTKLEKAATHQFLLAAVKAPRRFRAKFQQKSVPRPERQERGRGNRTDEVDRTSGFDAGSHAHTNGYLAGSTAQQFTAPGCGPQSSNTQITSPSCEGFPAGSLCHTSKGIQPSFTTTRDTFRHVSQSHAHEER